MPEEGSSAPGSAVKKLFRPRRTSHGQDSLMAHDSDEAESLGSTVQLGKAKSSSRSFDTSISRGSKDDDGHDSDGGKSTKSGGRLSKLLRRHKKPKAQRDGDGHDTPDDEGEQRGRSQYTHSQSVTTLGQPPTPGDHSSQLTSDEDDEDDDAM